MMSADTNSASDLCPQVRDLVWRIFGAGASPMTRESIFDLIQPVISKRSSLPQHERNACIAEIRGWFHTHNERHWLKAEMCQSVAETILDVIGTDFSDTAVWAVGSIDAEIVLPLVRARWSDEDVEAFCSLAIAKVQRAIEDERIFDAYRASRYLGGDHTRATVPRESIEQESKLNTFRHLDSHGWELVHYAVDHAVSNLVQLLVDLQRSRFPSLVASLDHPVLQALATEHFIPAALRADHRAPLKWIDQVACDALVALAVFHSLSTVNILDEESKTDPVKGSPDYWRTELRPGRDDLDAAARSLLHALVQELANLAPLQCVKWLGELLSAAPYILHGNQNREKPQRVAALEEACIQQLAHHFTADPTDEALNALRSGLSLTPRNTWNRHVADLAWYMHADTPEGAQRLALATIELHMQQIHNDQADNRFFLHWEDWHFHEWIDAMGRALLLSAQRPSSNYFTEWIAARCLELPLSAWDAEEHYSAFLTADRIAQHWFLVAIATFHHATLLGLTTDPKDIRALAELVWSHCHFTEHHRCIDADVSVAAEAVARAVVVHLGELDDAWLLQQVANSALCSRAVWGLADQYLQSHQSGDRGDQQHCIRFIAKFANAAVARFGDASQYSIGSLNYWARLWLLLDNSGVAEQTAIAITKATSQLRALPRAQDILILKLLALATCEQRLNLDSERYFTETYRHLWMPYTPDTERSDRAEVDAYLRKSSSSLYVSR